MDSFYTVFNDVFLVNKETLVTVNRRSFYTIADHLIGQFVPPFVQTKFTVSHRLSPHWVSEHLAPVAPPFTFLAAGCCRFSKVVLLMKSLFTFFFFIVAYFKWWINIV
jgi:hypothetical protein